MFVCTSHVLTNSIHKCLTNGNTFGRGGVIKVGKTALDYARDGNVINFQSMLKNAEVCIDLAVWCDGVVWCGSGGEYQCMAAIFKLC